MAVTLQDPDLQQMYNSLEYVRNKFFSETGKAIVAAGAILNKVESKNIRNITITEAPPYSKSTYRLMVERIDVVSSIIERAAELVCETLSSTTIAPHYVFRGSNGYVMPPKLEENIQFTSQWMRNVSFRNKIYDQVYTALWSGDSYAEIVYRLKDDPDGKYKKSEWIIPKITPINPEEMRVAREDNGKLIGYIQYPFNVKMSDRTTFNQDTMQWYLDNGGIFFKPFEMLHLKINAFPSAPYGTSVLEPLKDLLAIIIGMREDMATIIKNFAAPLILFKLGTDLIPASDAAIDKFRNNIMQQFNQSTNLITSSLVNAEILGTGDKVMNIIPYLDQMMGLLHSSTGIAEVMLGRGDVNHEAAKVQMEATSKKIRKMQWYIQEQIEMKVFPLLIGVEPDKEGHINITPEQLNEMPMLYFGPIETEEDKRIRYENGYQYGAISREEYRMAYGFDPEVKGTIIPNLDPEFMMEQIKVQGEMSMQRSAQANNGPQQKSKRDRDKTSGKEKGKKKNSSA